MSLNEQLQKPKFPATCSPKVKPGYKKTKLGWIPMDWDEVILKDATSLLTNGFVGKATDHYTDDENGVTYIQGYNVRANSFNFRGIKKVSQEFHKKNSKSNLREGDLLTIQTGDVGLTTIVPKSLEGSNCHALIISRFINGFTPEFYSFYYNSHVGRSSLRRIETGSTMKHLNVGDMLKWLIPVPPLPEQQKIATILSTWDKAIDTLQKLIDKKQERKKGLMQLLLTGKKRFDGYEEEWKEVKLGDIGRVKMCKRVFNSETSSEGDIPFYKIGTFGKKPDAFISRELYQAYKRKFSFPEKGDILISAAGTLGRAVVYDDEPAYFQDSNIVWLGHDRSKILNEFLFYVYKIIRYESEGGTIQRLYNSIILNAKLSLPSIPEQRKIASVLSSADTEIEKLQTQLDKLQDQKKGLMQKLLTGEVRVKTENQNN